jgi:hypothetical protein
VLFECFLLEQTLYQIKAEIEGRPDAATVVIPLLGVVHLLSAPLA